MQLRKIDNIKKNIKKNYQNQIRNKILLIMMNIKEIMNYFNFK